MSSLVSTSAVTTITENKYSYQWHIENFECLKDCGFEKRIISPTYSNCGYEWNAELENVKDAKSDNYYWYLLLNIKKAHSENVFEGSVKINIYDMNYSSPNFEHKMGFQLENEGNFAKLRLNEISDNSSKICLNILMHFSFYDELTKRSSEMHKCCIGGYLCTKWSEMGAVQTYK